VGAKCPQCATYVFPPRANNCPNPACAADELEPVALSRRGTLWSYTENHYAPPPPYPAADPFEPFAVAAVQLDAEGIIVLGKVVEGTGAADLKVGMAMELTTMPLYVGDDGIAGGVRRAGAPGGELGVVAVGGAGEQRQKEHEGG
jgi:uncharacterized OB-fold protein